MGILSNDVNCGICGKEFKYIKGGIDYKPANGYVCDSCLRNADKYGLLRTRKKALLTLGKQKVVNNKKITVEDIRAFETVCEKSKEMMKNFNETDRSQAACSKIIVDMDKKLFYVTNPDDGVASSLVFRIDQIESYHENFEYDEDYGGSGDDSPSILNNGGIVIELKNSPVEFISMHPEGAAKVKFFGQKAEIRKKNKQTLEFLHKITGKKPAASTKEIY